AVGSRRPVRMFTTPPGTSEVASTSASARAGNGSASAASTTTVLPTTTAGATTPTRPSRPASAGAAAPTTPTGAGAETVRSPPATGCVRPYACATLSAQPAYHTQRSTARHSSSAPTPTAEKTATRASSASATR